MSADDATDQFNRFASLDLAKPDKSFVPVHVKPLKAVVPCGSIVFAVKSRTDALSFDTATTSTIVGRILLVAHVLGHIPSNELSNVCTEASPSKLFVKLHIFVKIGDQLKLTPGIVLFQRPLLLYNFGGSPRVSLLS